MLTGMYPSRHGAHYVGGWSAGPAMRFASTWLQLTAAPDMRGRVLALLVVAIGGTTPIGAPVMGWLAEQFGTRATFVLAGVLTAIAAALALRYLRRSTAVEAEPAAAHHSLFSRAR